MLKQQIVHFKYIQFLVYQLHHNILVKNTTGQVFIGLIMKMSVESDVNVKGDLRGFPCEAE